MNAIAIRNTGSENTNPLLQSSLYDLMEALNEEVAFKEDNLVTEAVMDLMKSGKILWVKNQTTKSWHILS